MIHMTHKGTKLVLNAGNTSVEVAGMNSQPPALVEDALQLVFQAAHVSFKVRDYASVTYPKATKLYLSKDRRILTISSECGQEAEVDGSLIPFGKMLEEAGVPYVVES